jgi:hypothetical protein
MNGPEQIPFHAALGDSQHFGNLFGGPFLYVAQREHLLLAYRQLPKGTPDTCLCLAAEKRLFRGPAGVWRSCSPVLFGGAAPPLPPSGTTAITARIDAHSYEPRPPPHLLRIIKDLVLLQHLYEHLLRDFFGIVVIRQ